MKLFDFAIASVVDANTGYGLAHSGRYIDYDAAEGRGRSIRAKSVLALIKSIAGGIAQLASNYRAAAKRRRETAILLHLNDHLLDDIGLTREDVVAARLGQISLEQLDANRRANRRHEVAELGAKQAVTATLGDQDAINEAIFAEAKCA